MARIGHSSPRAALIYQQPTQERDRAIASYLDEQLASAKRVQRALVVRLPNGSWGAGGGLDPSTGPKS